MSSDILEEPFHQLLQVLDLTPDGDDAFTGKSMKLGWKRIYGGQVIAQALMAATRTVPGERPVHSLHAYFLRPGDPAQPIHFQVDRLRDGGSFSARHVRASQNGRAILTLSASFKSTEQGLTHTDPMQAAPTPEELPSIPELLEGQLSFLPEAIKQYWLKRRPLELRPIELRHYKTRDPLPPLQDIWVRVTLQECLVGARDTNLDTNLPEQALSEPGLCAAILAYLSDMTLLDTSLFAHGRSIFDADLQVASIDHAMWFHVPAARNHLRDWLFYQQASPASGRGCGLAQGGIYTRDGLRLASVAQEGLIRLRSQ